jgi:phenylpyruvate tautomerase PptA (4-oxalocrotonate tautomerase family)
MPLVTLTLRQSTPPAIKAGLLDAVHDALVGSGVPVDDLFQRVIALDEADFRFDPRYPDIASDRTDRFALVEILWSFGRSVKVKRALLQRLMASAERLGLSPEHVMVCFKETAWENWSFGGGRLLHT